MGRGKYYLLVKNINNGATKVISMSNMDIYGEGSTGKSAMNSLERIDIFTTNFQNSNELVAHLIKEGLIDSFDVDVFIVKKKGGKMDYYETLFASDEYSDNVRKIAKKRDLDSDDLESVNLILDRFASLMAGEEGFYKFVVNGYSMIYDKYAEYFSGVSDYVDASGLKMNSGAWAQKSYPLLRNIVETIKRYKYLKTQSDDINVDALGLEYMELIYRSRNKSIDDINDSIDHTESGRLSIMSDKTNRDKFQFIVDSLKNIDLGIFVVDGDNVKINKDKFNCKDEFKNIVDSLDNDVLMLLYHTIVSYRNSEIFDNDNGSDIVALRCQEIINNEKILNHVYAFLLLYNNYYEGNKNDVKTAKI